MIFPWSVLLVCTHLFCFIQWYPQGYCRYDKYATCVKHIIIQWPKYHAPDLENIEWIDHFFNEKGKIGLDFNIDGIFTKQQTSKIKYDETELKRRTNSLI